MPAIDPAQEPAFVPEIDVLRLYPSVAELHTAFITNQIPEHCWLRIKHARVRIRPETRTAIGRGLLLALEVEGVEAA